MKRALRKEVLRERIALSAAQVAARSRRIWARLFALPAYRRAGTVKYFVDFRNEVATGGAIRHSLAVGKRVLVPLTDSAERRMTPAQILDYPGDLQPGAYGILEPRPDRLRPVPPEEIDLVAVPGVAFDPAGNRLGYGGGFYDRFLPRLRPTTSLVALAFELQIRDQVYPEAHDCPVDWIVTEERCIRCVGRPDATVSRE